MTPSILANMRPARRAGLAALAGGLYAVAQPEVGAWFLAPIALVPLFVAAAERRPSERFVLGWLCGGFAAIFVLRPVGVALASFFGWSDLSGWLAAVALGQIFGALPIGLAMALGGGLSGARFATLLLPGTAWVACEWVRSHFMGGAAWGLFAYSLTPRPELAQLASWGGSSLLTFALVCVNVSIARCVAAATVLSTVPAAAALCLFALTLGNARTPETLRVVDQFSKTAEANELRIAVIQGALPLAARRGVTETRADTRTLARQSDVAHADLVIWSESAYSLMLPENLQVLLDTFETQELPRWLLVGAPRSSGDGPPFNSALLIEAEKIKAFYDKVYLVPFAEFVPDLVNWFTDMPSRRQRGRDRRPIPVGDQSVGVAICYDVLFAGLARDQVRAGATVLANLSNDEWFGGTQGVEQHVAASVLRAIETGRPMLRATNTGVTTAIDARGRRVVDLPRDRPGEFLAIVRPDRSLTPYMRFGDWAFWCSLAGLGLGSAARYFKRA